MRLAMFLAMLLTCACARNRAAPASGDRDFDAFEQKWNAETSALAERLRNEGRDIADKDIPVTYRGIFVGHGGVIVDRARVATLDQLDAKRSELAAAIASNVKLAPTVGLVPSVVFDLEREPAAVATAALRLFAGQKMLLQVRDDADSPRATHTLCGDLVVRTSRSADHKAPQISLLLDAGRIWVGLSQVNEFQEIVDRGEARDWEKLEAALKEHKSSSQFAERTDIELGAGSGTAADVLALMDIVCKVGFIDPAVLPRDQLSAVPQL